MRGSKVLTFSEALVQLKSGMDLRINTWPRGYWVRAVMVPTNEGQVPELRQYKPNAPKGAPYQPTQAELFSQSWRVA